MRADAGSRLLVGVCAGAIAGAGCGRVGYDPVPIVAAGGRGGAGGLAGASGAGGTGGGVGGSSARGGAGGSSAGSAAGGAGGAGGSSDGGDAGSPDGDAGISCFARTFGAHDYLFCDALVDWSTARTECEQRGMRLVRVDDAPENGWLLANAVFSASMSNREALWLGGHEPTTDGDWRWTDGAAFWSGAANGMAVGGLYTNWDSREPNNAVGPEACLAVPLNGTTWIDYECAARAYFACERY